MHPNLNCYKNIKQRYMGGWNTFSHKDSVYLVRLAKALLTGSWWRVNILTLEAGSVGSYDQEECSFLEDFWSGWRTHKWIGTAWTGGPQPSCFGQLTGRLLKALVFSSNVGHYSIILLSILRAEAVFSWAKFFSSKERLSLIWVEALAKGETASSTLAMAKVISSASSPPFMLPFMWVMWEGSGDLRWLLADGILDRRPLVVAEGVRVTGGGADDLMAAGDGESLLAALSKTKVPSRFAPSVQSCSTRWCLGIWSLLYNRANMLLSTVHCLLCQDLKLLVLPQENKTLPSKIIWRLAGNNIGCS